MQNFTLVRKYRPNEATLGKILDPNNQEICKTLENPWLDNQNEISCIPEGTYEVEADNSGKFQYWRILNIPGRDAVEIHSGNKEEDTKGCLIIGARWGFMDDELAVLSSRTTLKRLKNNKTLPEKFTLEITSNANPGQS